MTRALHLVVPDGLDDSARPSGGNTYDRRLGTGLRARGRAVHELVAPGTWPDADGAARRSLAATLATLPDDEVVMVDGLVASAAPEVLRPEADRLRLVVLAHMPFGELGGHAAWTSERQAMATATAVVTTSSWTRDWLVEHYRLDPARVHVAEPGADRAPVSAGTPGGGQLLCVAAVTPGKGHDVLVAALDRLRDLEWTCTCVGSLESDVPFAARVTTQASDRVQFTGALPENVLAMQYAAADLLVLPTRTESYGLVVTEALGHGLPVVATDVGGLPGALGRLDDGRRPGMLVPPDDPTSLAAALRAWLEDEGLRERLREVASARRTALHPWSRTAAQVDEVLAGVAR